MHKELGKEPTKHLLNQLHTLQGIKHIDTVKCIYPFLQSRYLIKISLKPICDIENQKYDRECCKKE